MSSDTSQISALVALITNAAKTVEAQFLNSSKPVVPSLDDTTPHPLDTAIASVELQKAIETLEGACAQLCATAGRPNQSVINKAMSIFEPACLNVAVTYKIPDILQEAPSGMHIDEVAKKADLDPRKLVRVLRLLATKHVFREVTPNIFANNRLSLELLSTNPVSKFIIFIVEEVNKPLTALSDTLGDPVWGPSNENTHTAFSKSRGSPQTMWEYYGGEGKEYGARFGIGLTGWNTATQSNAAVKYFPWGDLPDGASVCDVGGSIGYFAMQLAKAHPTLQLKLQDMPDRVQQAKTEFWPKNCPEAIQENRIEFKPINFLVEAPIKDCDVYYMKSVIHNWPDKESLQILRNVRNGMAPHSRLLLHEYIIQPTYRVSSADSEIVQAPEPLLPNYGLGQIRGFNLDLCMMTLLNSRERTLDEHTKLINEAGLRFVKVWAVGESWLIECSVA